jgi:hypothetical protein
LLNILPNEKYKRVDYKSKYKYKGVYEQIQEQESKKCDKDQTERKKTGKHVTNTGFKILDN